MSHNSLCSGFWLRGADDEVGDMSLKASNAMSGVWKYVKKVEDKKAVCLLCRKINPHQEYYLKANANSSTTNYWRHIRSAHMAVYEKEKGLNQSGTQRTLQGFILSSTRQKYTGITFEVTKDIICRCLCKLDIPWRAVEDLDFRKMLRYFAQSDVSIPGKRTIRRHAIRMFGLEKEKLVDMLSHIRRVFIMVDSWTTDNQIAMLGITVHWIDNDWKLRERVLTLRPLEGEQSGEHLAEVLVAALKDFRLQGKIMAVTTDNSSNNLTMVDTVIASLRNVDSEFNHTRHMPCLAHIINITIQDGLRHLQIYSSSSYTEDSEAIVAASPSLGNIVARVRQVLRAIQSSPQGLQKYKEFCRNMPNPSTALPPLDCPICWNSTYDMLQSAHAHKDVLHMIGIYMSAGSGSQGAQKYYITESEWSIVHHLTILLKPFRDVIQFLNKSKAITASKVLLSLITLTKELKERVQRLELGQLFPTSDVMNSKDRWQLTRACQTMIKKLEKYAARLSGNNAFAVAAVLDPMCRMAIIPSDDQSTLRSYIQRLYKNLPSNISTTPSMSEDGEDIPRWMLPSLSKDDASWDERMAQNLPTPSQSTGDELEDYLHFPPMATEALAWWKGDGSLKFPKLAVLAKDFLAICATSAPEERFFSSGRNVATPGKSRLNTESVSTLMTLKCWIRQSAAESYDMHGRVLDATIPSEEVEDGKEVDDIHNVGDGDDDEVDDYDE